MKREFKLIHTKKFLKMLAKLDYTLLVKAKEKLVLLQGEHNHEVLKVHKLKGKMSDKYSFSIDHKNRIVFEYEDGNLILLLAVGSHDMYSRDL